MPNNQTITELYLIRHAETVMNTNPHLIAGRSNESPLTPRGIEQAKALGQTMLKRDIIPDKVFTSPARRTIDTAHYSLAEMGLDITPIVQDEIQEIGQGEFEGKPRAEVYTDAVLEDIARRGKDFKLSGGESMNDVANRMGGWLSKILAADDSEEIKRYFVYTHGGSIKYYASSILGWDHQRTFKTVIDNTSDNLFIAQDGILSVAYLNGEA